MDSIDEATGAMERENEEVDRQEQSSSLSSSNNNEEKMEEILSKFRSKWHEELTNETPENSQQQTPRTRHISEETCDDIESRARELFLLGVENEQKGKLYEAIQFYRKAVQLVPDIEFKLYDSVKKERAVEAPKTPKTSGVSETPDNEEESADVTGRLQGWISQAPALCQPAHEQRGTHISSLPVEILVLIFRWVVSRDLDIRSLDMCSLVCRGFYCCARDSEIWRLICLRLWGVRCDRLGNGIHSWREMYMQKPHLHYSGCYISKTTYIRHGENSFQDQFYRPWHIVEYYRYLRFFPEGRVLMMTTAEGPAAMVGHLRDRSSKFPAIIVGHYRVNDDIISLVLTRSDTSNRNNRYRSKHNRAVADIAEETYNIELQLKPLKSSRNWQLVWTRYRVFCRRGPSETVTNFEVLSNKFPPFWFSRVKSYAGETDTVLV